MITSQQQIVIGGTYKHYKGQLYKVHGLAKHSETLEELVYYECLYTNAGGQFWVRPKTMFLETIMVNGTSQPRFQHIDA